jgi:hypothetical protein
MPNSSNNVMAHRPSTKTGTSALDSVRSSTLVGLLTVLCFHWSMVSTSAPLYFEQERDVDRAIELLRDRGFEKEVFLLEHTTTFRRTDNWLNRLAGKENAFAATNLPFQIVTLYPDFYQRPTDDTERAMILLHEAQHLMGKDEASAYAYVWRNRSRLGWTQLTHGTTETYITISELTRENAPELFNCPSNLWNDCTETLAVRK